MLLLLLILEILAQLFQFGARSGLPIMRRLNDFNWSIASDHTGQQSMRPIHTGLWICRILGLRVLLVEEQALCDRAWERLPQLLLLHVQAGGLRSHMLLFQCPIGRQPIRW